MLTNSLWESHAEVVDAMEHTTAAQTGNLLTENILNITRTVCAKKTVLRPLKKAKFWRTQLLRFHVY